MIRCHYDVIQTVTTSQNIRCLPHVSWGAKMKGQDDVASRTHRATKTPSGFTVAPLHM